MRVAVGCDHRGYELKKKLKVWVEQGGHEYHDFGCFGTESVDYPDIAIPLAQAVAAGQFDRGILLCSTGIGMSIAANKIPGVRAALCYDTFSARRCREHNDANVLCLGAEALPERLAQQIVEIFLASGFEGKQHQQRLDKIKAVEGK